MNEKFFWSAILALLLVVCSWKVASGEPFGPGQVSNGPISAASTAGTGGISGPGSSTDNAIPRWDGVGGDTLQDSGVLLDDSDNLSGIANLTCTGTTTLATSLTGPLKASSGVVSASNVNLTSEVTGALPITNGGTGQSSQTSAFDALSPTTTKGDISVHNGTNNVRLAVCSDGEAFLGDSGQASGLSCGLPQSDLSDVTGTLGISNGGTGQTAKTQAFDALSPTTTKGDLIASDGTNNVRFPVCSDGDVLTGDSGEATGWVCETPAAGATWGSITGTLSSQTDLQTALDAKVTGPASATSNAAVVYDGTTGKLVKNNTILSVDGTTEVDITAADLQFERTAGSAGGAIHLTTDTAFGLRQFGVNALRMYAGSSTQYIQDWNYPALNIHQRVLTVTGGAAGAIATYTIRGDGGTAGADGIGVRVSGGSNTFHNRNGGYLALQGGDISGSGTAVPGAFSIRGGSIFAAGNANDAADTTITGGNTTGSGNGGDLNLGEGTSSSGSPGIVVIGLASSSQVHRLNIATEAAGSDTATMTNSPVAGNPSVWVRINVNGTEVLIPGWTAP